MQVLKLFKMKCLQNTLKLFMAILSHMKIKTTLCVYMIALLGSVFSHTGFTESKRIEVYPQGQQYYDVRPGDSLSSIVMSILPNRPQARNRLMAQLLELNPQAFVNNDPSRLKANTRLWFSSQYTPHAIKDPDKYIIQDFSWGQLYKPKR